MRNDKRTEQVLCLSLVIPVIWFGLIIAPYMDKGLFNALGSLSHAMNDPFHIVWCDKTLKTILVLLLIYSCCVIVYLSSSKNYRRKEEYGSARWASPKLINQKYTNQDYAENKLFTKNVRMGLDVRRYQRNLNTLVIGGSGAGKTRFYGKPNIMQCNTSFVILDPKGGAIRSRIKSTCAQLNI